MSAIALAEVIDALVESQRAFVVETEQAVTVSGLSAADAGDLETRCAALGWVHARFDSAGEACAPEAAIDPDFAPYRLVIQKPGAAEDSLRLLTNHAFLRWLQRGHAAAHWQVARMTGPIATQLRVIQPWGEVRPALVAPPTKSPRALVREYGTQRAVPDDIRPWLCHHIDQATYDAPGTQTWVRAATVVLVRCLGDDIDPVDGAIKFRGPPRLTIAAVPEDASRVLAHQDFTALQDALHWVFENEREAEMRHILLAAELARCTPQDDTLAFVGTHIANAWESAQIAYQMALSDTSRDTLKVLTELRKAITEETAKLSDLTRQLMAAVASALAIGIGLVAARLIAGAPPTLVAAVMIVATIYVLVVIVSGEQFIRLQRSMRIDWQPRLYQFLPAVDYERMVGKPAKQAERSFRWVSFIGMVAVLVLTIACLWPLYSERGEAGQENTPSSSDQLAPPLPRYPPPSAGERHRGPPPSSPADEPSAERAETAPAGERPAP